MTKATPRPMRQTRGMTLVVAFTLSLLALSGCGDRKSAADYIKTAQAHREAGEIRASVIDLKNALQKEPRNVTARVLLGQSYLDLSDAAGAEVELRHARDDGAPAGAVALPLARAELLLRKPRETLALTEPIDGASPQLAASLLALRGEALFALGRDAESDEALNDGLKLDPESIDVLAGMARTALSRGDLRQAKDRLAAAQKEGAKVPQVMELAGDVTFASGDFAASEQAFQALHDAQPWRLLARLGMARAQIAQAKLKEAIGNLDILLKSAPKDSRANYYRALVAYRSNDMPATQTYSQRALSAEPEYTPALLMAGASSYALKQYEQASNFLGQYVHLTPDNLQARKLLASTQLQLNRPGDAVKTLAPAVGTADDDTTVLALIGDAAARTGDAAAAQKYLQRAVEKRPDNAALRTELGASQLAVGDTAAGIEELEKAAAQDPKALKPEIILFTVHMRAKNYDKALEVADRVQKNFGDNTIGLTLAGLAHLAKGDTEAGRAELLKVHEKEPGNINADRNLALIAMANGKPDEARKYYQDILTANPKAGDTYIDLAELEDKSGHPEQAVASLRKGLEISPDDLRIRYVLASILLASGNYQDAFTVTGPGLAANPGNPGMLELAGQAQLGLGQADAAVETFKSFVKASPQSSAPHRRLAEAYIAAGKRLDAIDEARQALTLSPSDGAKFFLAQALTAAGKLDEGSTIVRELKAKYPKEPRYAEYEGTLAMRQNRPDEAVSAFQTALSIRDDGADRRLLAAAQTQAGHPDDAEKTLKAWLDTYPKDAAAHVALGDTYLAAGRADDAAAQYAESVKLAPASPLAENNLAWALAMQGKSNEALAHARHAATMDPGSAVVLDTLGTILLQAGIPTEAVENLKKARKGAPGDPAIQFHLAQALAEADQKTEALDVLHGLLAGNQQFKDRAAAEKLLQQLAGG